jgi:glycosyltransferase involved in cell wall biosynthesis
VRLILLISNDSRSLLRFRWRLIEACLAKGWKVMIACNPDADYGALEEKSRSRGVSVLPLDFDNGSISPLNDLKLLVRLRRLYKTLQPTHVLLYRIKPVLYGSLASFGLPIQIISTITGLGYVYATPSVKARFLRVITNGLYKLALSRNSWVFFQNKEDRQEFIDQRLLQRSSVVGGSGVDLTKFPETPLPEKLSFLMVARLLKDKGVWEYLHAAAHLKKKYPVVEFKLVGGDSSNPTKIPRQDVINFCQSANLEYLGYQEDMVPILQDSSVFVLPSSYREGIPRAGLEALSIGRPIITTDTQGCRELVCQGNNGFLVPIKDTAALEQALQHVIDHPEILVHFAKASRHRAETLFDVALVNASMIEKIEG